ncbi:MAG: inorganic phosphate transporter, partial [Lentimicrobiaceae bacterium]|nr:inorganic phosphate transporter [Lentimicrobiaceae bacterium]
LIGTFFGSGMMEIAKSGVFHPNMFHFHDVMILFLAVLIADVIILDVFNSLGFPTSTTVSLVFELLGAAVVVGLFVMYNDPNATSTNLSDYINSTRALIILSAIFSSVVIALVCGSVVMYLSRLLFTFDYEKKFKYLGAIWCGIAFTAIIYFAIFKGLKSTSLVSDETLAYLKSQSMNIILIVFTCSTALYLLMQHLFKINILKVTILIGTASIALSFAGNDLVNFIGVPMGGYQAFEIAREAHANGIDIGTLTMEGLKAPVKADWRILIVSGMIMVLTLFFSKKARRVTDTEVQLARQDSGVEQFGSMQLSRTVVRGAVKISKKIDKILPQPVLNFLDSRFKPLAPTQEEKPHFDFIRASVNLTVATLLISLATSLKLPLSTTYVTFMIAMGTSLADRAWGRESAVYRITGVITVVSGWFITAVIAFTTAGFFAWILMFATGYSKTIGLVAVIGLGAFAVFRLITSKEFRNRQKEAEEDIEQLTGEQMVYEYGSKGIKKSITQTNDIYTRTLDALFKEDHREMKLIREEADKIYRKAKNKRKYEVLPNLERLGGDNPDLTFYYIQVVDYNYEVSKSLLHIIRECYEYIDNNHEGFSQEQIEDLKVILDTVNDIYTEFLTMLDTKDYSKFDELMKKREVLNEVYFCSTKHQIKRAKANESGTRNTVLFLYIINETRTLILQSRNLMKSQRKLAMTNEI